MRGRSQGPGAPADTTCPCPCSALHHSRSLRRLMNRGRPTGSLWEGLRAEPAPVEVVGVHGCELELAVATAGAAVPMTAPAAAVSSRRLELRNLPSHELEHSPLGASAAGVHGVTASATPCAPRVKGNTANISRSGASHLFGKGLCTSCIVGSLAVSSGPTRAPPECLPALQLGQPSSHWS